LFAPTACATGPLNAASETAAAEKEFVTLSYKVGCNGCARQLLMKLLFASPLPLCRTQLPPQAVSWGSTGAAKGTLGVVVGYQSGRDSPTARDPDAVCLKYDNSNIGRFSGTMFVLLKAVQNTTV
jgi:hypothetical protein